MKLNIGDIFTIPLGNNEVGFGQVVSPYNKKSGGFMMATFNFKCSDEYSIIKMEDICKNEVLFLGLTFDAKIYHKDWIILGNYKANIESIKMPFYRLGTPPNDIFMVNYKGDKIRPINEQEFNKLTYRTEIAPIRYENALKAHYKIQEWISEDYDKLLYKKNLENQISF
jgi:hypothetical protein